MHLVSDREGVIVQEDSLQDRILERAQGRKNRCKTVGFTSGDSAREGCLGFEGFKGSDRTFYTPPFHRYVTV